MNNLEVLSDQLSKLTEMLADSKVGPRPSKASSRRTSDASLSSWLHEDDETDHTAIATAVAADVSFIESDDICQRAKGKGKGKAKQVSTATPSFQTNVDREEIQDTEAKTPRNRVEKCKGSKPPAVTAESVDATAESVDATAESVDATAESVDATS
ncbi:hypothetical protein ACHAPJ_011255 [Fusarium lateritium]